jgi:hypothetical protein
MAGHGSAFTACVTASMSAASG